MRRVRLMGPQAAFQPENGVAAGGSRPRSRPAVLAPAPLAVMLADARASAVLAGAPDALLRFVDLLMGICALEFFIN